MSPAQGDEIQNTVQPGFSVVDACGRIQQEFKNIQAQYESLKIECEKLTREKSEIQRHYIMYYEMSYVLNAEMHKHNEVGRRLAAICSQTLPFLTREQQHQVILAVQRSIHITTEELSAIVGQSYMPAAYNSTSAGGACRDDANGNCRDSDSNGGCSNVPRTNNPRHNQPSSNGHSVNFPSSFVSAAISAGRTSTGALPPSSGGACSCLGNGRSHASYAPGNFPHALLLAGPGIIPNSFNQCSKFTNSNPSDVVSACEIPVGRYLRNINNRNIPSSSREPASLAGLCTSASIIETNNGLTANARSKKKSPDSFEVTKKVKRENSDDSENIEQNNSYGEATLSVTSTLARPVRKVVCDQSDLNERSPGNTIITGNYDFNGNVLSDVDSARNIVAGSTCSTEPRVSNAKQGVYRDFSDHHIHDNEMTDKSDELEYNGDDDTDIKGRSENQDVYGGSQSCRNQHTTQPSGQPESLEASDVEKSQLANTSGPGFEKRTASGSCQNTGSLQLVNDGETIDNTPCTANVPSTYCADTDNSEDEDVDVNGDGPNETELNWMRRNAASRAFPCIGTSENVAVSINYQNTVCNGLVNGKHSPTGQHAGTGKDERCPLSSPSSSTGPSFSCSTGQSDGSLDDNRTRLNNSRALTSNAEINQQMIHSQSATSNGSQSPRQHTNALAADGNQLLGDVLCGAVVTHPSLVVMHQQPMYASIDAQQYPSAADASHAAAQSRRSTTSRKSESLLDIRPHTYHISPVIGTLPVTYPTLDSPILQGMPRMARPIQTLKHGEIVCAVVMSRNQNVYTGAKGCLKIWKLDRSTSSQSKPIAELECFPNDSYIRSCKLLKDERTILVGGEADTVIAWDLASADAPKIKGVMPFSSSACYALAVSHDSKICYSCYSNGAIGVWDIHNQILINQFKGHTDGASCVDVNLDDSSIWSGGLDHTVRCWDMIGRRQITALDVPAQVFSLSHCPCSDWIVVGLENNLIEVLSTIRNDKYQVHMHKSSVLSVKFAGCGSWFVSTGKDSMLNGWTSPFGTNIFKVQESTSVLNCDISADDEFIVAGSGDKQAVVYEVVYRG